MLLFDYTSIICLDIDANVGQSTSDLEDHYIFYQYERYAIECNQRVPRQLSNSKSIVLCRNLKCHTNRHGRRFSLHLLLDGSSVDPRF